MNLKTILSFLVWGIHFAYPQNFDCPPPWLTSGSQCYQFYGDAPKTYEQAKVHCTSHGAGLVSVTSARVHRFIDRWLQVYDTELREWYTSGIQESTSKGKEGFMWQGTGEVVDEANPFWIPGKDFNNSVGVIVYTPTESGYLWGVADPSERHPYICEVPKTEAYRILQQFRDYDYGLQQVDINRLERGPHFILQPHSTAVVGNSPTVALECVATGIPEVTYTWYRGENYETLLTPEVDKRYTLTNGKLIITSPDETADSGKYRCHVENKYGTILSDEVQLSFGFLGEFSNVPDAPVNAKAYEGAAIDCSKISYRPAVQYMWFKKNTDQFVRPEFQKYMFISQNGKLYFSEVTRADEGIYNCLAILTGKDQHTIGSRQPPTRNSLPITLHVHDQAPMADWGPVIQDEFINIFPQPALVGQDIRMECFAYGSSTTEFYYNWERQGKALPKSSYLKDSNRVLIIRDVKLEDQGIYTCRVSRGASARDSKSIDFTLGAKPYFSTPIGDQHVDIGSPLTWRCDARANPAPSYLWYRDGRPVKSDPARFITVRNNVLVISKLDPKLHNGMYQCAATNSHGTTLSEGQLRVLAFAPHFYKYPLQDNTRASIRGNLTLACRPEGAPLPVIKWYKNGAELPVDSDHYRQMSNGHLIVAGVHDGDRGTYSCTASNKFGNATDSTEVTVAAGTHITVVPQDQVALVNTTVFFFCHASHAKNADMVYNWLFNGWPLDTDRHPEYRIVHANAAGKTGLYITSVSIYNRGYYECVATTTINSDRKRAHLTVVAPPSEPAGVVAEISTVTNSSVLVKWTESSSNGRAVTRYIVEAATSFQEDLWEVVVSDLPIMKAVDEVLSKRSVLVTGLNPGCGYRFRVIAVNQIGRGPPSQPSAYIQTLSAKPIVAPINVGGGGGSVGDLTMTWKPLTPAQQAGSGIGYRLYYRRHTGKEDDAWTVHDIQGNADHYVTLVGVEKYYLEYDFKIQAFNHEGFGPNSTEVVIMSAEDLPVAIATNVMADGYNGSAMEVTWNPVPEIREYVKGKILGYQINYWHEEEVATDYKEFIRVEGQVDTGIVIGLKSDNFYFFTIQVYNSAGLGPISEFYFQESLHAPAFKYPEEVRVYSAGGYRVRVWWRGVDITQPESDVYGYVIYYWPANEHYRTAAHHYVDGRRTYEAYIEVKPAVVYALRVSAFSDGGYGKKSPTTYFTLEGRNVSVDFNLAQTVEAFVSSAMMSSISAVLFLTTVFFTLHALS